MRTLASFLITLTFVTAGASAQDGVQHESAMTAAWSRFAGQYGAGWQIQWNAATGTPEAVWGPGLRLTDGAIRTTAEARPHAEATLKRFADLLGRGDSTFVEVIGTKAMRVHVFVYQQYFKGLKVIDGRADVRIHDNGVLSLFGSQAFQVPPGFTTTPKIGVAEARVRALTHLRITPGAGVLQVPKDVLVVWADIEQAHSPVRLAWELKVAAPDQNKIGRAYVDARNGRFLQYRTDLHECFADGCAHEAHPAAVDTGAARFRIEVIPDPNPDPSASTVGGVVKAWTNVGASAVSSLSNVPVVGMTVGSTTTDASGRFVLGGSSATVTFRFDGRYTGAVTASQGRTLSLTRTLTGTNNVIQIYSSRAAEFDRSQSTIYHWINRSMEFIIGQVGNRSQLASLKGIRASANIRASCNATYSRFSTRFYASSSTCNNTGYSSVVSHEWGHGLDDSFGGIARGQMQEGLADTVPMMILDDPVVGRFFRKNGGFVRTGTNTKTWPPSGGVHSQGEVWMGWYWDCRNELRAKLGAAAGLAQARKLFSNVFVPDPRTQQAGAREVALLDDNDGNLNNGTPNCSALIKALTKRRIPNPIRNCGGGGGTPGTYAFFGAGCRGSGGGSTSCGSANSTCRTTFSAGNGNHFALQVRTARAITLTGFELLTKARSRAFTLSTQIFLSSGSRPALTPVRSGSGLITTATKLHATRLTSPLALAANTTFYISFGDSRMVHPICTSAGGTRVVHFWRPSTSGAWRGPFLTQKWAYKLSCAGGGGGNAVPLLTNAGLPNIGKPFGLRLSQAKASTFAWFCFGGSKTSWPPFRLPVDLTPFGAPGCSILASCDAAIGVRTDSSGSAAANLTIPTMRSLIGGIFYNQGLVADTANRFGFVLTRAGQGKIGNQ